MKKYTAYTLVFTLALFSFIKTGPTVFADTVGSDSDASNTTISDLPVNNGDTSDEVTVPSDSGSDLDNSSSSDPINQGDINDNSSSSNPTNLADNSNEGSSSIPTNSGDNSNGASSSIPTNLPSNNDIGSSSIPMGQGSNDDDTTIVSTSTDTTATSTATTTDTTTAAPSTSGGGSSTGNVEFSGGGGGGSYALSSFGTGTTTASTTAITGALSCPLLTGYVIQGQANNPSEITKLQLFLNTYEHDSAVSLTGTLDQPTINGILAFQQKYLSQIMGPWGSNKPSGDVYITTQHEINSIVCGPQPSLTPAEQGIINAYLAKSSTAPVTGPAAPATIATNVSSSSASATSSSAITASTTNNNSLLTGSVVSTGAGNFFGNLFSKIVGFFSGKHN